VGGWATLGNQNDEGGDDVIDNEKRRAVAAVLLDPASVGRSDSEIARRCNVVRSTVHKTRAAMEAAGEIEVVGERTFTTRDGRTTTARVNTAGKGGTTRNAIHRQHDGD
jgi:transposase-like protein